jgi:hypothetical protein
MQGNSLVREKRPAVARGAAVAAERGIGAGVLSPRRFVRIGVFRLALGSGATLPGTADLLDSTTGHAVSGFSMVEFQQDSRRIAGRSLIA